ncbi:glycosyl transferase [Enterococcus faecium]|nr:glycosyl transferase [Enterococcus faecium]
MTDRYFLSILFDCIKNKVSKSQSILHNMTEACIRGDQMKKVDKYISNEWFDYDRVKNADCNLYLYNQHENLIGTWIKILQELHFSEELFLKTERLSKQTLFLKDTAEVSVCIISKNEEKNILRCIDSIYNLADEIIFVDTGSTDHTRDLIEEVADTKFKIFDYEWSNDFSAARNFSIEKATKEWILVIDSDEYILPKEIIKIKLLISMFDRYEKKENIRISCAIKQSNGVITHSQSRLFRNNGLIKYFGLVHEELRINKKINSLINIESGVSVFHDGYSDTVSTHKEERNTNLLLKMMKIEPTYIRWTYMYCRDSFKILPELNIKKLLLPFILKNYDEGLVKENIQNTRYTNLILLLILKKSFMEEEEQTINKCISILEARIPNSSDIMFYKLMKTQQEIFYQQVDLLKTAIRYRKRRITDEFSQIGSNLLHFDLFISSILFDIKSYENSFSYFETLNKKDYFKNLEIPFEYKLLSAVFKGEKYES